VELIASNNFDSCSGQNPQNGYTTISFNEDALIAMTEDALMRKGTVILQSCTVSLEVVPGLCSEISVTSSDDTHEAISIKVEETAEPISFPEIKVEPEEVSYLSVCLLLDTSPVYMNVLCLS
jgi:hypothetical protein